MPNVNYNLVFLLFFCTAIMCEGGSEYQPCGDPCQDTCRYQDDVMNAICQHSQCVEGCFCPQGMVKHGMYNTVNQTTLR